MSRRLPEQDEAEEAGYGLDDDENADCSYCGGDGWGIEGDTWDCDDPLWISPGTVRKCPNCHGSGQAKDMTFW